MRVLVTGAGGFVGTRLVERLVCDARGLVRAGLRRPAAVAHGAEPVLIDMDPQSDWRVAVNGIDVVVHLAARVHVMRETVADPEAEFRRVNVAGTLNLAEHAAAAGVRRFVFLSSVKVNGESGIYTEADAPAPDDPYGASKLEAETALRALAARTGIEVTIVRPPLVYGPGVRANFHALMRAVAHGIPLPLGAVDNRRSLVALDNLLDFIVTCAVHPAAANETFLVSDGDDLSTPELVRRLARAMRRRAILIPVPPALLAAAAALIGQRAAARRLLASLRVDITKARQQLDWTPPISVDEGLRRAVGAA